MIRIANIEDIDVLIEITKACTNDMIGNGIFQWNEHYPSKSVFNKDLDRKELHVLELMGKVIGCVAISSMMDKEYLLIDWLTENNKNLYVHRLAIHPDKQGKGYAQELMDFAEKLAIKKGCTSIRLDTFSQNSKNQKFYELRGYKRLGSVYFPQQSEFPFYCYELVF
jgi:ribosomal protein S18 acetylase RimI-like enzyme